MPLLDEVLDFILQIIACGRGVTVRVVIKEVLIFMFFRGFTLRGFRHFICDLIARASVHLLDGSHKLVVVILSGSLVFGCSYSRGCTFCRDLAYHFLLQSRVGNMS